MANALNAEADFTLEDGRKFTLVFDLNAFIDIGEELGKARGKDWTPDEIVDALKDEANPPGLKFQRVIIWGGLRKHHPEMTIRDAGEVMVAAADAMARALNGGMPEGEDSADEADANPPKRKNGRGTASATAGLLSA